MALEFTSIADRAGAACYVLHRGTISDARRFERLSQEITKSTDHQVVVVDARTTDGERIRDFYDIMPEQLPAVLIINDDDSVAQLWSDAEIPGADMIAYQLKQISS